MRSYREIFRIKPRSEYLDFRESFFIHNGERVPLVSADVLLYKGRGFSEEILIADFLYNKGCIQFIKPLGCQVIHCLNSKSLARRVAFAKDDWEERVEVFKKVASSKLLLVHEDEDKYYV